MTSCFMDIDTWADEWDFTLINLEYDESIDLTVASSNLTEGDFIGNENNIKLTFKGAEAEQSLLTFE